MCSTLRRVAFLVLPSVALSSNPGGADEGEALRLEGVPRVSTPADVAPLETTVDATLTEAEVRESGRPTHPEERQP